MGVAEEERDREEVERVDGIREYVIGTCDECGAHDVDICVVTLLCRECLGID
jgi:hypothetical protein